MNPMICKDEQRREKVRQHQQLNGLDFLEVSSDQSTLTVHFLGKAAVELDENNIRIEGGQRIRDIQVKNVEIITQKSVDFDNIMQVVVDQPGDFSNYSLRVVEKDEQGQWQTHPQFDPRYDRVEFNFKVDCPNELDCKQELVCPPEQRHEPDINYLAKDYASFRQLILDRLALVMPDWQERHVPDIGIALVEVLAYVGDHLSYYQDAVATEAYLDTARKRISVRRHARLVDYTMHEGCNARAWVCMQVSSDLLGVKPGDIKFITGFNQALDISRTVLKDAELQKIPASQYEVFEPITTADIQLYSAHNRIKFYTWCDQLCCLPKGSTSATLVGEWIPPGEFQEPHCEPEKSPGKDFGKDSGKSSKENSKTPKEQLMRTQKGQQIGVLTNEQPSIKLRLKVGDVLILEEVIGPETGHPQDANPRHRHVVRLTTISGGVDPLTGQAITHISWSDEDALPFPLCLSVLGPAPDCVMLECISVACGNVVLVDHGHSVTEDLPDVPAGELIQCCKKAGLVSDGITIPGLYKPTLAYSPLTFCEPLEVDKPASHSLVQDPRNTIAKIQLVSDAGLAHEQLWQSTADLLTSQADDLHFVAEMDNDGRAQLRFGNDEMGRRPEAGTTFKARYRIGNGLAGNVGAEVISRVVFAKTSLSGVNLTVRNPLPAQGGTAAEPLSEVKLFAPNAFRKELQRAVTADDYAAIVLREFKSKVQGAVAKLRWNGSWYEVLVAIDVYGQEQADPALLAEITGRLHRYRRMGHDLVVQSAQPVALDIELIVCVLPNYLRGHVKAELISLFSNKRLNDGRWGFFHADKLKFGEDIYLSKLVALAQSVEGVSSVEISRMQRWCERPNNEIDNGVLPLGQFEIARLDNDPSFPENGILTMNMGGGR